MRAQRRAASVQIKTDFGAGTGRGAGFYRQWAKMADPATASEEAASEEKARRRAERQRAARAAWEAAAKEEAREERAERAREQRPPKAPKAARDEGAEESEAMGGQARDRTRSMVLDLDRQRRPSFAEYEASFQAFRERARREGRFAPGDVPLPPRGQAIEPALSLAEWQRHTKQALLRWHPDKWASLAAMLGEVEAEQLKALTEGMFRAVSRAKDRGFLPQRWAAQAGA